MSVEGSLDLFRLPEILQVIAQQRKTGILTVQGAEDIIAVSFLGGRIVAADALNETTEEGLGAVLVAEHQVSAEDLRRLAARSEAKGTRLADLLVSEGVVDRAGLLTALRLQTQALLMSLLDWRQGEFKFYGGDEVSFEEGFQPIGVDELLLRAIESRESGDGGPPALDSRLRRLDPPRPVRTRDLASIQEGKLPPPPEDGEAIWLTPEEERLLDAIGPGRTLAEAAMEARVVGDRARYLAFRLFQEGLAALAETRPARPVGASARVALGDRTEARARPDGTAALRPPPAGAPRPAAPAPEEEVEVLSPKVPVSVHRPLASLLALAGAVLLVAGMVTSTGAFLLPFPWETADRQAFLAEEDSATLLELDQAAKTYFLLQGHFPDDLAELVDLGLLRDEDLRDARGRPWVYTPEERRYSVRPLLPEEAGGQRAKAEGGQVEATLEGITGNFLLDPEFLRAAQHSTSKEPPLVLLD